MKSAAAQSDYKGRIRRIVPKAIRRGFRTLALLPDGEAGVARQGHRNYVGGFWEEMGELQFDFLLSHGLKADSYLLDIACGSLRLGVKAIPFLERSHYLGIDKEDSLVKAGLEEELDPRVREQKEPRFVISDSFEFERFGRKADFAIAQSLFTHMPLTIINLCFSKLHPWLEDDGVFFATFFETSRKLHTPKRPHDQRRYFAYTEADMCAFGEVNGFASHYIGDWNHPRQQVMVEYRKRPIPGA